MSNGHFSSLHSNLLANSLFLVILHPHWEQESSLNSGHIIQILWRFRISRSLHFCFSDWEPRVLTDSRNELSSCLNIENLHGNIGASSISSCVEIIVSQLVHLKTPLSIAIKLQNIYYGVVGLGRAGGLKDPLVKYS